MLRKSKVAICLLGMFGVCASFYGEAQTFTKSFNEATVYSAGTASSIPNAKPTCSGDCYHSGKNLYNYRIKILPELYRTDGKVINCTFGNSESTLYNNKMYLSGVIYVGTNGWNSSSYQSATFTIADQPGNSWTDFESWVGSFGIKAWDDHKIYLTGVNATIYVDPARCPVPPTKMKIKAFWVKQYSRSFHNDLTFNNLQNDIAVFSSRSEITCSTTLNFNLPSEMVLKPGERKQLISYSNVWNSCSTSKNRDFYAKFTWDNPRLNNTITLSNGVSVSNGQNDRLSAGSTEYYVIAPSQAPIGKTLLGNLNVEITWP
ncbi:TPA: hypothetical protein JZG06_004737 [Escherichia coli]|nr:hypothetical protein [Escherichia coli]